MVLAVPTEHERDVIRRRRLQTGSCVQPLRFELAVVAFARLRRAVLYGSSSCLSSSVLVLSVDLCAAMGVCGAVTTCIWALRSPKEPPGAAEARAGV